jgi:hypothetical protein
LLSDVNWGTAVREAVRKVVPAEQAQADYSDSMRLVEEIGLKSLAIARVIALLEIQYGVDPFSRHVSVTSVRTLGDLVRAYQSCANEAAANGGRLSAF